MTRCGRGTSTNVCSRVRTRIKCNRDVMPVDAKLFPSSAVSISPCQSYRRRSGRGCTSCACSFLGRHFHSLDRTSNQESLRPSCPIIAAVEQIKGHGGHAVNAMADATPPNTIPAPSNPISQPHQPQFSLAPFQGWVCGGDVRFPFWMGKAFVMVAGRRLLRWIPAGPHALVITHDPEPIKGSALQCESTRALRIRRHRVG